jgi:lipopolysaccharide transport system permease protein
MVDRPLSRVYSPSPTIARAAYNDNALEDPAPLRYATTMPHNPASARTGYVGIIRDTAVDAAILMVAYLIATYFRQTLPIGRFVGESYTWFSVSIYAVIVLGAVIGHAATLPLWARDRTPSQRDRLAAAFLSLGAALVLLTFLLPLQSGLQKGFFAGAAAVLLLLIVPVPAAAHTDEGLPSFGANLRRLHANRGLLRIWVQYNVQSRYAQAFLGILWIILLPLSSALVMNIVFSELLRVQTDVPFISFLLVGLVCWGLFSQAISAGMRSILGAMGLVNQIYFPREIIVLSALGEAMVDAFFMLLATIVINAFVGIYPTFYFLLLPFVIIIQLAFCLGLMFIVSWLSVLVRDIPQLISVLLQILFYLCPIIYPLAALPARFQPLIALNPLAALINAYRDLIIYGRLPDLFSLVYPAALAVGVLIFGYRLFKSNEDRFADMV